MTSLVHMQVSTYSTFIVELTTHVYFLLHQVTRPWFKKKKNPSSQFEICDIACIICIYICFNKVGICVSIIVKRKVESSCKIFEDSFNNHIMVLIWARNKLGYNVDCVINIKATTHLCKMQATNNLYIQKIVIKIFNANELKILVKVNDGVC
jgi:hypothetical protein